MDNTSKLVEIDHVKGVEIDPVREKLVELFLNAEQMIHIPYGMGTKQAERYVFEKMADHLISNGVTVLPCNVGQKIWLIFTPKYPANPNDKGKWFMVQDGVQRIILGARGVSIETWNVGTIPAKEIGKKLFFTEEEAKAALPQPPKEG